MNTAIPFIPFCVDVLRLRLSPAQRVWGLVAVDGVQPRDLSPEDREVARTIFGDVDVVPPEARRVLLAVWGRGSGKDHLGGAYGLWRLLTVVCSRLGPGDEPSFIVVAPDKALAGIALARALALARSVPSIARLIESESADGFTLRRPDGVRVSFEVLAATRGGSAVRGRSVIGALMSEAAFFHDSDSVVNDAAIFAALMPRLMEDGAILPFTTPWSEMGLVWELYSKNYGQPRTALVSQASSLVMRDHDPDIQALWDLEHERDAENAACELGARFKGAGASAAFRGEWLAPAFEPLGEVLALSAPFGLADFADGGADAATWCVGQMVIRADALGEFDTYEEVQADGSKIEIFVQDERGMKRRKPAPERRPIVLLYGWGRADTAARAAVGWDAVAAHVAMHWRAHGVRRAFGDQYQGGPVISAMARGHIQYAPQTWTQPNKVEALARARNWFRDGAIHIEGCEHTDAIRKELLNLAVRPTPGGGTTIAARTGHDDFAALVLNAAMLDAAGALQGSPAEKRRRGLLTQNDNGDWIER